jgi:hypothetical protein
MTSTATMSHSKSPLCWSGSTGKILSIQSRQTSVTEAAAALTAAAADSAQNRALNCRLTAYTPHCRVGTAAMREWCTTIASRASTHTKWTSWDQVQSGTSEGRAIFPKRHRADRVASHTRAISARPGPVRQRRTPSMRSQPDLSGLRCRHPGHSARRRISQARPDDLRPA